VQHSFNKLFAIKVFSLFVWLCDTHTSHSLKHQLLNLQFHCIPQWYVLCFTCIISKFCLQYAAVLQAGIIFQAINRLLFFLHLKQKRPLLAVSVIKHTFTTTHNMKLLHILCMSDNFNCLLWHYSPTVYYLLQCWFSIRKRTGFAGNV